MLHRKTMFPKSKADGPTTLKNENAIDDVATSTDLASTTNSPEDTLTIKAVSIVSIAILLICASLERENIVGVHVVGVITNN